MVGRFSSFFLVFLALQQVAHSEENNASNAHERIRQSLLYIEGTGADKNGIPIEVEGSGIVVDKEGLALTALHVLAPLAKADNPPKLRARLSLKTGSEFAYETKISLPDRDVQLIKLVGAVPFTPPRCFRSDQLSAGDIVLTSGFPANDYYRSGQGTVENPTGPRGTIVAFLSSDKSQSGSPVYDLAGRIVGLLKGALDGSEFRSVIIPTADFIHLLPESAKKCESDKDSDATPVKTIVLSQTNVDQTTEIKQPDARVELAGTILIGSKDLVIQAKEIVAQEGSEIRGFPSGSTAASGARGEPGSSGDNAPSRSGQSGGQGLPGSSGGAGGDGLQAGSVTLQAQRFSGELVIDVSGQGGGDGGSGGAGGDGGHGAAGRNSVDGLFNCKSGPGNGGDGGRAGQGGNGGRGGHGGDGALVNIKIGSLTPDARISVQTVGGLEGKGGNGGEAGRPGKPGPRGSASTFCGSGGRGSGNAGQSARDGSPGQDGEQGDLGIVAVRIGSESKVTPGKCLITATGLCL